MTVVPESFTGYFAAGASAAAALVGLLFVAISLRPASIVGETAVPGAQALAGSTFTSLVNAFFLSFTALLPGINLGYPAVTLAVICLYHTFRLHRHLSRSEAHPVLLLLSLAAFGTQLVEGVLLTLNGRSSAVLDAMAYLVVASFAVALSRAWALMQGRHVQEAAALPSPPDGR
ncbi:MAG: hypothetical protein WBA31_01140 [Candidatus Dormiibacterota bacterium]